MILKVGGFGVGIQRVLAIDPKEGWSWYKRDRGIYKALDQ